MAAISLAVKTSAQPAPTPTYAGRPFVRIAQANSSDPVAGFYSGFGRAQLVGDAVVFAPHSGGNGIGVFSGRGGPLTKIAKVGEPLSGVTLQSIHTGFARDTGSGAIAIAAGPSAADAVQLIEGAALTTLLAPGAVLPNSGGQVANVMGEPFLAQGNVAVIAWKALPNGGGVSFRGVYRLKAGALEAVSDTATALPGAVGIPDGYSSQVGFDGQTIAFWATRGPFTENEGMFMQAAGGTVTKIAQNGDTFPDGGTMDGFISPPFVSAGIVYFFAFDSASKTRLLKYENGALATLAANGDETPKGPLQGLGQYGLAVDGGKVFFPARTSGGAGLYMIDGGPLQTVIAPGANVGGIVPTSIVLQDFAGDTIVVEVANSFTTRLVANLAQPAVPVLLTNLAGVSVPPGTRVELNVAALGDAPLAYTWAKNGVPVPGVTGPSLVIESASASDIASYYVTIANTLGSVFSSSALVNVEVPPIILNLPAAYSVEAGDQLALRVDTSGGLPQTFYWSKDGAPATSESTAIGFFVRATATPADAGRYSVIASNAWGVVTAESVVTILPAGPNPTYKAGRFVKIMDDKTVAPGTSVTFGTASLAETSARWQGSRVVFTGQSPTGEQLGVFAWENGNLTRLLAPDAALPNGLGNAAGFNLVSALPGEPLFVKALQMVGGFPLAIGIYKVNEGNLETIADTNTVAPGANGAKFTSFFGESMVAGGKLVFVETVDSIPSIYLWENGSITRILNARQNLPVVEAATVQFYGLAFNGADFVITAATSGQQNMAALKVNLAGEAAKIIARNDPLPGTAGAARAFGSVGVDGADFYLSVYDASFGLNILAWNGTEGTRRLGPGSAVNGVGSVLSVESSYPKAGNGVLYTGARIRTDSANVLALVAASETGTEPVLMPGKLDARRFASAYMCDVSGDKLLIMPQFADGSRGYYANVGAPDEGPLRLAFTRPSPSIVRFDSPAGTILETALKPEGPWGPADSSEVTISEGTRFFRLKK
jgi:hypothetical protein